MRTQVKNWYYENLKANKLGNVIKILAVIDSRAIRNGKEGWPHGNLYGIVRVYSLEVHDKDQTMRNANVV